jgi:hypothetical protein
MAKIVYRPYEEIIVHEVMEFKPQSFLEFLVGQLLSQGQTGLTPVANWTDGIAFSIGNFLETPEMVKEKMEGRIHWGAVYFTRTNFQPEKKIMLGSREYVVRFVKADGNPDFVNLARYLSENIKTQS